MNQIKEKLKKSPVIVRTYELVFGRLHRLSYRILLKRCKRIKFYLTTKKHFSYGDKNKDKVFLVISCNAVDIGVFSTILCVILPYIEYAVRKKYIPVIDLSKTYLRGWQDKENWRLEENPWEYYYEQPVKQYTLEEVYQSRHVIQNLEFFSKARNIDWGTKYAMSDKKELAYWNKMITTYIRLNDELENRIAVEEKRIFQSGHKVLGVGVRAGIRGGILLQDPVYNNHPIQPTCEELMDIVEEKMKSWECDALFISSDDREYLNKFILRFGDKCYYTDRILAHWFENDIVVANLEDQLVEFKSVQNYWQRQAKEYITDVYLLAQCHSLYSCRGSGYLFAHLLNGGQYEHLEVYDKGVAQFL